MTYRSGRTVPATTLPPNNAASCRKHALSNSRIWMKLNFSAIQQLGRALMLPIAVLPAAALLLRFGQGDMLNLPFMSSAGAAIFDNLGLLFAIGIAVGFAKENNGAAGIAGIVGYFVTTKGAAAILAVPPELALEGLSKAAYLAKEVSRMSVPAGILTGISAGILYNRFHAVVLPEYLSFFGGRRFVPIATGFFCLGWALAFGHAWPVLSACLDRLSLLITASGNMGLFLYGALNRLLIMTGLHHIINNVVWFLHGSFTVMQDGVTTVITGDLNRFSRGDPTAGAFMAGFFPVMMFGLPAACLALYKNALPAAKSAVGGVLLSMALTAFLTGITEPIEFAFMFLAPPLYALHAVLTGASLVVMNILDVKLGFGFSAGFIDYAINFSKSTRPLLLFPVGAVYAVLYYTLFSAAIRAFDLKTLGREAQDEVRVCASHGASLPEQACEENNTPSIPECADPAIQGMVEALGGSANICSVNASATRLLVGVKNNMTVDRERLQTLGAFGFATEAPGKLHIVLGPAAVGMATSLQAVLAPCHAPPVAATDGGEAHIHAMIAALGGPDNLLVVDACATRLRLRVAQSATIDDAALKKLGAYGLVRPDATTAQVVLGPTADTVAAAINIALRAQKTSSDTKTAP